MTGLEPEAGLRAALRMTLSITVLTGGQTGVDTLAARAALAAGLPVHVVFPRGFRQEDGPLTPERRAEMHGAVLHQLPGTGFARRTRTCVNLADAVLLFDPAGGAGCEETVRAAARLGRPLLDLTDGGDVGPAVLSFLGDNRAQVLMIAGCRGSLLASQADDVRSQLEAVTAALRECQG